MRDASSVHEVEFVDLVDDGMTEEEIAMHTDEWRKWLEDLSVLNMPASAAGPLAAVRAEAG